MIAAFIIYVILILYFLKKIRKSNQAESDDSDDDNYSFTSISEQLDKVNEIRKKLSELESMITEIEICDPGEQAVALRILMPTNRSNLDLISDRSSEKLLDLLYHERKKLRSSLTKEIQNLQIRCNENCNENYSKIQSRGVVR